MNVGDAYDDANRRSKRVLFLIVAGTSLYLRLDGATCETGKMFSLVSCGNPLTVGGGRWRRDEGEKVRWKKKNKIWWRESIIILYTKINLKAYNF